METDRINLLLNNPSEATKDDIFLLENEISKYPYSQVLHILLAKIQFQLNIEEKNEKLAIAAIYSGDRSILKKVIQEKDYLIDNEKIIPHQGLPEFEPDDNDSDNNNKLGSTEHTKEDESSSIFDEVLKNLERLKSLRQQFQFLELNEPEPVSREKSVREKKPGKKTKKNENVKSENRKLEKTKTKKADSKQKKLDEILEKDEVLDSQVNEFFLSEIKENQESIEQKRAGNHIFQKKIIEKFIEEQPSIGSAKNEVEKSSDEINKDLSEKSTKFGDDLVSENLAIILLKQGKKERAIDIYKKLIWKLPQKKAYFAARIEEIKK